MRKQVVGTNADRMVDLYSTARAGEKCSAVAKVVSINTARAKKKAAE